MDDILPTVKMLEANWNRSLTDHERICVLAGYRQGLAELTAAIESTRRTLAVIAEEVASVGKEKEQVTAEAKETKP